MSKPSPNAPAHVRVAYEQGYAAFRANLRLTDLPPDMAAVEQAVWRDGYYDALHDDTILETPPATP